MKPIKVTIIGLSVDLGLLGETYCTPAHSLHLWLLLVRLFPSIFAWLIGTIMLSSAFFIPGKMRRQKQREMSHFIFGFLLTKENFHEQENGFLNRIENQFNRPTSVTNLSKIGQSMRLACKNKDRIPSNQDIVTMHLGSMDFINKVSCTKFRAYTRELLADVGKKNPQAHIIYLGLPDLVVILSSSLNLKKALPLPFSPTVGDLHSMEGFHKHLNLTAKSTAEEIKFATRLLEIFTKILVHELNRARGRGIISSYSFVDARKTPVYSGPDRALYFGLDGMHMSREGVALAVEKSWPDIFKDLAQSSFLESSPVLDGPAAKLITDRFGGSVSSVHSESAVQ